MFRLKSFYLKVILLFLISLPFVSFLPAFVNAGINSPDVTPLSSRTIVDSKEPYNCRVYSYDMGIDSKGDVHIVYSNPNAACTKADIYYIRRVSGVWQTPILISNNGSRPSISTLLTVGDDDRIHICYVLDNPRSLQYLIINNGAVVSGYPVKVWDGGWHTRMQLDNNGYPVFVREGETWPALETKLTLITTTNGTDDWTRTFLNLTPPPLPDGKFRVADFIYDNGTYHITFGGSEHKKEVWQDKTETVRIDEIFHDLHYAVSPDGTNWTEYTIDSSATLHDRQFWTSLVLDGVNPLASMYKYNEAGGRYNYGTSANLMTKIGSTWDNRIITDTRFTNLEGMGPGLAVNGPLDYFCAWDFSPDFADFGAFYDESFYGQYGNIALARNGPKNDWTPKVQIAPFSLEGRAILKIHGGKMFFLGLGNWFDARLHFSEYSIVELNKILPRWGMPTPPPPGSVKVMTPINYLLLRD